MTIRRVGKLVMCTDGKERVFYRTTDKYLPAEFGYVQEKDATGKKRTISGLYVANKFAPDPRGVNASLIAPKSNETHPVEDASHNSEEPSEPAAD